MLSPPTLGSLEAPGSREDHLTELTPQVKCGLGALLRRLFEAGEHDLLKPLRNRDAGCLRGRLRSRPGMVNKHRRRLALEDRLSSLHPEGDEAKAIDICT